MRAHTHLRAVYKSLESGVTGGHVSLSGHRAPSWLVVDTASRSACLLALLCFYPHLASSVCLCMLNYLTATASLCISIRAFVCVHVWVCRKCPPSSSSFVSSEFHQVEIFTPFTLVHMKTITRTQTDTLSLYLWALLHSYFIALWASMSYLSVFYCNMKELLHKHANGFDHIMSWTNRKQQGD